MADIHIYKGRFTNTSDILYTFDGEHIYSGRYTNTSDVRYTFDGKHLYDGRFTNTSDICLTVDGKNASYTIVDTLVQSSTAKSQRSIVPQISAFRYRSLFLLQH